MNLNDIKGAVEDLVAGHGRALEDTVYTLGDERGICGIDEIDGDLYVLSSDGNPAVSNTEYMRLIRKLHKAEAKLLELYEGAKAAEKRSLKDARTARLSDSHLMAQYFEGSASYAQLVTSYLDDYMREDKTDEQSTLRNRI